MTPEAAKKMLGALRWGHDTLVVNHFGESVWLKRVPERTHVTECCFESKPCEHHAILSMYLEGN